MILKNGKSISSCPWCGCDVFYVHISMSGRGEFNYRFDGTAADNTQLHDSLKYKEGKTIFCRSCDSKIGMLP